ncbi:uncharacterized protein LOC143222530 [Tachypleus tridentatus]|uniref:uncharacterized protein LOC143222530 n=1 Tax=Tachypleus tridentatus TaxID=6853 RepID=UPI003FD22DEE
MSDDKESNKTLEKQGKASLNLGGLNRDSTRSAFTPYRPSTVLTNLQRGNVQTQTPAAYPERTVHQLAAQGELFREHITGENQNQIDKKDDNGLTPIAWASAYGQLATVRLLLAHRANATIVGHHGESPLLFASANGHSHILRELFNEHVDIEHVDDDGNTALMYAAFNNHPICIQELLNAGANITARNNEMHTAYEIAVARGSKHAQQVLEKYMMEILLKS